jgi:hypothetical protein
VIFVNWLSTIRQYIRGAWEILGNLPGQGNDDFERLGWASDYQREFLDPDHSREPRDYHGCDHRH